MGNGNLAKATAGLGLGFIVVASLSGFVYPQQPRVDSTPAATMLWVHDHRLALQVGMIFAFFAGAAFLCYAAYVRNLLIHQGGLGETLAPVAFASGIGVGITSTIAAIPYTTMAFMQTQPAGIPDATVVRMLGDLNTIFFSATSAMTFVFIGVLGLAMVRGVLLAPWLGWLSLLVAAFNGLGVWIGVTFATYHGKGWMAAGWGAYVGFLVIILLSSVSMLLGARAPATPRASVATT